MNTYHQSGDRSQHLGSSLAESDARLSRRAADRYAVLQAVAEQKRSARQRSRAKRALARRSRAAAAKTA